MARRKKEPKSVHRENIAAAASALFMEKGTTATSMNDIAKAAGYSKATLYVYFENKEEIIGFLVLDSMKRLGDEIEIGFDPEMMHFFELPTVDEQGKEVPGKAIR